MRPALLWRGSYDYERALSEVLPAVAAKKIAKGGFMVLRPDSGDAIQTVVMGLRAAEKVFGCDTNAKGFKVPRGCSVIQGACGRHATRRSAGALHGAFGVLFFSASRMHRDWRYATRHT
jgi:nicotinamide phosphoribosyltransferase